MPEKITTRGVIGKFYAALKQNTGASWIDPTSMYFASDQEIETYPWLGQAPTMRKWTGKRHAKGMRENVITIRNVKYESTLEVPVDWIRRDKTGQLKVRINEQALRANTHWASLLTTLMLDGQTTVCYDEKYFYDDSHEEGKSGVQSNLITVDISTLAVTNNGTPTAPSASEMVQAILTGCQQVIGFVDDQGEPMNEDATNFLVLVPTSFWMVTAAALKAPVIDGGDTNIIHSASMDGFNISFAVNPRLKAWTDEFAIFRTDGDAAAFIRQEEEGLKIGAVAEGSELEFNEDVHHFGIKANRAVGYGYWQKSCKVKLI